MSNVQAAGSRILYPEANGLLGWPDDLEQHHNGVRDACDMMIGPCVCGEWHHREEWASLLARNNAEIRDRPKAGPATLYYF